MILKNNRQNSIRSSRAQTRMVTSRSSLSYSCQTIQLWYFFVQNCHRVIIMIFCCSIGVKKKKWYVVVWQILVFL